MRILLAVAVLRSLAVRRAEAGQFVSAQFVPWQVAPGLAPTGPAVTLTAAQEAPRAGLAASWIDLSVPSPLPTGAWTPVSPSRLTPPSSHRVAPPQHRPPTAG